jgi:GNAT superfamily N-acetyltransferase
MSTVTHSMVVRDASLDDATQIAAAVAELLEELGGGTRPHGAAMSCMEETTRTLISSPELGTVVVADVSGTLVGVLAASWQTAIHVPGRYALIQDLWVDRAWRRDGIGAALVATLFERARAQGIDRVEVGLPREDFSDVEKTQAFYLRNGFTALGPRMRAVPR